MLLLCDSVLCVLCYDYVYFYVGSLIEMFVDYVDGLEVMMLCGCYMVDFLIFVMGFYLDWMMCDEFVLFGVYVWCWKDCY